LLADRKRLLISSVLVYQTLAVSQFFYTLGLFYISIEILLPITSGSEKDILMPLNDKQYRYSNISSSSTMYTKLFLSDQFLLLPYKLHQKVIFDCILNHHMMPSNYVKDVE